MLEISHCNGNRLRLDQKEACHALQQMKMISHLIKKCCFMVGNLLLLQCIGIPLGTDPTPIWENLYLQQG